MSGANLREYAEWIILSGMISWTVTCFTNKRECKVTGQEIEDKKLMYKRLLPRKQERKLRPRQHEQAITWQASGACACYSWRWFKLIVKQRYILYHMYGCFKTVQNVASSVIVYLRSWAQSRCYMKLLLGGRGGRFSSLSKSVWNVLSSSSRPSVYFRISEQSSWSIFLLMQSMNLSMWLWR